MARNKDIPRVQNPPAGDGHHVTWRYMTALNWPSVKRDKTPLYTDEQLSTLEQARTRVRLRVEQQVDGSLKGYGFYTGKNRDWEMDDVVQFTARGDRFVADLGEGIELLWTPAVDGSDILGIPVLDAARRLRTSGCIRRRKRLKEFW